MSMSAKSMETQTRSSVYEKPIVEEEESLVIEVIDEQKAFANPTVKAMQRMQGKIVVLEAQIEQIQTAIWGDEAV